MAMSNQSRGEILNDAHNEGARQAAEGNDKPEVSSTSEVWSTFSPWEREKVDALYEGFENQKDQMDDDD